LQATSTNNFITTRGGTTLGQGQTRTTRPGIGSHLGYSLNQWGWEGTTLGWRRAFYTRGEPSPGAECASSPCSPSSRFPFAKGCVAASPSSAAVDLSGFSGGAYGVITSGPHSMTGVPSKTWSSPIAGTGVPLLVHSCIRRFRACLRLLSNRFAADRGCGSCLGLGCSYLLQSHRELCLLSPMDLLPQNVGLLVKELIQEG